MITVPPIVSVDDHLVEPPDLWTSRLPSKYKDLGPRIVYAPQDDAPILDGAMYIERPGTTGNDVAWWVYEDFYYSIKRVIAAAGFAPEDVQLRGVTYEEMRKGCWDRDSRLSDMSLNHVEASLCFPNYPRFAGQIFLRASDKEVALACVRAYNDFMVEEWCAGSEGRLIPLCIVPLWDAQLAEEELDRNAARGVRAVAFTECPNWLDLPSIHSGYWDRFLSKCAETSTVVCLHIGSGTRTIRTGTEAPDAVHAVNISFNSAASLVDWLFADIVHRQPNLRLLYAEAQIGWIPYVLERCDDVWRTHLWATGDRRSDEAPSTYYRRQVHSCFFKDSVGLRLLDLVGVDNVLFETDYPHQDGTWPRTREIASTLLDGLHQDAVDKILRGNAIRLFGLDLPGTVNTP